MASRNRGLTLAAVLLRPGRPQRRRQLLGVALWGAFGLLLAVVPAILGRLGPAAHLTRLQVGLVRPERTVLPRLNRLA